MPSLSLKPTHKAVTQYYDDLQKFASLGIAHESAVRSAFQELLEHCARQFHWKLVPEYALKRKGQAPAKIDGAVLDDYGLVHAHWEAKDDADDLDKEIKLKFAAGYPKDNILFWQPDRAILYQHGERVYEGDLRKPDDLIHALALLLEYAPPALADWQKAVEQFKDKIPQLGDGLKQLIEEQRRTNKQFIAAFADFLSLCRGSLNPNLSELAVEEMIIQHLLTERIFRKIFDVADFTQRNVIAQEIEKVIGKLTSKAFNRDSFSAKLNHFYVAIENAAATIHDFTEKQTFLNTVYERFFQGFCIKVADTHGIVYTPQPLVNFMVASVEQVLKDEFGKSLADRDVHILDPFTGTGNFIVNLMKHIPKTALPHKYKHELHCNEIMLLPYYVASMNLEHAYYEATGTYEPFEGICLVDTFQTAEKAQGELSFFSEKNSERVDRQKKAPIRVIIANPPYNAGQANENDNNKNRKYPELDRRVSVTYGADSEATLQRKLSDPYVKAIRCSADRIGESGVVCFVNNNSFVTDKTFDGMRKNLVNDFDLIYVLDLGGNVRKNPKLSGTTHNVFGIQVGVSINLFIRLPKPKDARRKAKVFYHAVGTDWRKEQKYEYLEKAGALAGVKWLKLTPDKKGSWLTNDTDKEFSEFLAVGSKEAKASASGAEQTIFDTYSLGVSTNRDAVVFDFDAQRLAKRVEKFTEDYNAELHRWQQKGRPANLDDFLDTSRVKWSETLKRHFANEWEADFSVKRLRQSLYRPFCSMWLYYDTKLNDRPGAFEDYFPSKGKNSENRLIAVNLSPERPFCAHACKDIPSKDVAGGFGSPTYCFPLHTYSEDGKTQQDNVTLGALVRFQNFYGDDALTRADVFYYVYAVLHHSAYRTRYAENLKRELPRIPLIAADGTLHAPPHPSVGDDVRSLHSSPPPVGDEVTSLHSASAKKGKKSEPPHVVSYESDAAVFHAFAAAGRKLADLHVHYETAPEFPLQRIENKEVPLDWRVEVMKLVGRRRGDESHLSPKKSESLLTSAPTLSLVYNDFLTLTGIPAEALDYRLGNRSALEWVIDQYRVARDEHGKVTSDPNRLDDEQYIVRLVGQVITVSLETQKIVQGLPQLRFEDEPAGK